MKFLGRAFVENKCILIIAIIYFGIFADHLVLAALPNLKSAAEEPIIRSPLRIKPSASVRVSGSYRIPGQVDIILENGYPVDEHINIKTEDGYLLDMQRIPHGLNNANDTDKPAVLLMHGFLGSAENWLITGPEKALAFILADEGYDVWLGNARGTTHSRKHTRLNPNYDLEYWQFSWHEIGIYDLPAKISYIVKETGQDTIFYIGHSQGCTSFFVMASERPQYNNNIRLMVALAPAVFMDSMDNPFLQLTARLGNALNPFLSIFGVEFMPNNELMSLAGQAICNQEAPVQEVCANMLFLIAGYDSTEMNRTALPTVLSATPAGASTKQLLHFAQGVNSGSFRYYDYGMLMNMMRYNSMSPPKYPLDRVAAPVAIFYSQNDWLVSEQGVKRLEQELPNVVYSHLLSYQSFNHLDFLWASNVVPMLYNQILDLLKQF